eukprot:TRINITY_DN18893_c0_g1_i1.p1 TRINITY_DN18893_c0_g1~~TRINITY_DN18893_c0_g1_i1.p1  ORF type:complete len:460 (+),score=60.27 TRINITY_DN18893_c0_g1_i1:42-1382(+)
MATIVCSDEPFGGVGARSRRLACAAVCFRHGLPAVLAKRVARWAAPLHPVLVLVTIECWKLNFAVFKLKAPHRAEDDDPPEGVQRNNSACTMPRVSSFQRGNATRLHALAIASDNDMVALGCATSAAPSRVTVVSLEHHKVLRQWDIEKAVLLLKFVAGSGRVVACTRSRTIVWCISTGATLFDAPIDVADLHFPLCAANHMMTAHPQRISWQVCAMRAVEQHCGISSANGVRRYLCAQMMGDTLAFFVQRNTELVAHLFPLAEPQALPLRVRFPAGLRGRATPLSAQMLLCAFEHLVLLTTDHTRVLVYSTEHCRARCGADKETEAQLVGCFSVPARHVRCAGLVGKASSWWEVVCVGKREFHVWRLVQDGAHYACQHRGGALMLHSPCSSVAVAWSAAPGVEATHAAALASAHTATNMHDDKAAAVFRASLRRVLGRVVNVAAD